MQLENGEVGIAVDMLFIEWRVLASYWRSDARRSSHLTRVPSDRVDHLSSGGL
jgi:hypothetical protein